MSRWSRCFLFPVHGRHSAFLQGYKLGDPTLPETNLGPVFSLASAERIRKQVADAGMVPARCRSGIDSVPVKAGAKALIPEDLFPIAQPCVTI